MAIYGLRALPCKKCSSNGKKGAKLLLKIIRKASKQMAAELFQFLATFSLKSADHRYPLSSLEMCLDKSRRRIV